MRASKQSFFAFLSSPVAVPLLMALCLGGGPVGCTLITDVNREDIPEPPQPPFPEVDAGAVPEPVSDAGAPDASADASVPDAAAPPVDGGLVEDAGVGDAGADADAG